MNEKQIRAALRKVGVRRKRHRQQETKLQEDTAKVLQQARGKVPTTEAAELVGLNRSTVYEVYKAR